MHKLRIKICHNTGVNSKLVGDTIIHEGQLKGDSLSKRLLSSLKNIVNIILGEEFSRNIETNTATRSRNNGTGICSILENSEDDISNDNYKILKESIFFFFDTISDHSKKEVKSKIISDVLSPELSDNLLKESHKFLLSNGDKKIAKSYRIEFDPHEDMNLGNSFLPKPGSTPNRETKEVIEGRVISLTKKFSGNPMKCTVLLTNNNTAKITVNSLDHYKTLHQMMDHDNNINLVFETTLVKKHVLDNGNLELDNITNIPDSESFALDIQ